MTKDRSHGYDQPVTDEDVYGKSLGKPFRAVRAELCRPGGDPDEGAALFALYLRRRYFYRETELRDRVREACTALDGAGGLFASAQVSAKLAAASTESLQAQHMARAYAQAADNRGDARAFLKLVAQACADEVAARLAVQSNYRDDRECQNAASAVRDRAVEKLAASLRRIYRNDGELTPLRAVRRPESLLDFVVAQSP